MQSCGPAGARIKLCICRAVLGAVDLSPVQHPLPISSDVVQNRIRMCSSALTRVLRTSTGMRVNKPGAAPCQICTRSSVISVYLSNAWKSTLVFCVLFASVWWVSPCCCWSFTDEADGTWEDSMTWETSAVCKLLCRNTSWFLEIVKTVQSQVWWFMWSPNLGIL